MIVYSGHQLLKIASTGRPLLTSDGRRARVITFSVNFYIRCLYKITTCCTTLSLLSIKSHQFRVNTLLFAIGIIRTMPQLYRRDISEDNRRSVSQKCLGDNDHSPPVLKNRSDWNAYPQKLLLWWDLFISLTIDKLLAMVMAIGRMIDGYTSVSVLRSYMTWFDLPLFINVRQDGVRNCIHPYVVDNSTNPYK